MKIDRDRQFLTIDPSLVTGEQFKDIITAVVEAVPDAEMVGDSYSGLVFQQPEVVPEVVPANWIEGEVKS